MSARDRLAETLAIVGFGCLFAMAVLALAVLTPWWQLFPACLASGLVMVEDAEP